MTQNQYLTPRANSFAVSPTGWTDQQLALSWFEKSLELATREKAAGETRHLLLDGHSSHFSYELVNKAIESKVEIYAYPPHCTHALQAHDVVCFAKQKRLWNLALDDFEDKNCRGPNKEEFTKLFGETFLQAFTPETIASAFRITGVYPFNRNAISEELMRPSEPTGLTKNAFPQPLPDLARCIMAAWHGFNPNERKAIIADAEISSTVDIPVTLSGAARVEMTHTINVDTEVSLFTPTKRVRLMTHSLARSSSGSLLISSEHATSAFEILPPVIESHANLEAPDWSLLNQSEMPKTLEESEARVSGLTRNLELCRKQMQVQDSINEGIQAQLVVQSIIANKMKAALGGKEKKAKDKTPLFKKGEAKFYTDREVQARLAELKEEEEEADREKDRRVAARQKKKRAMEAREQAWKDILATYDTEKKVWAEKNEALKKAKIPVKDRPKPPKRPRKPVLAEFLDTDEESTEDGSGDEGIGDNDNDDDNHVCML